MYVFDKQYNTPDTKSDFWRIVRFELLRSIHNRALRNKIFSGLTIPHNSPDFHIMFLPDILYQSLFMSDFNA